MLHPASEGEVLESSHTLDSLCIKSELVLSCAFVSLSTTSLLIRYAIAYLGRREVVDRLHSGTVKREVSNEVCFADRRRIGFSLVRINRSVVFFARSKETGCQNNSSKKNFFHKI